MISGRRLKEPKTAAINLSRRSSAEANSQTIRRTRYNRKQLLQNTNCIQYRTGRPVLYSRQSCWSHCSASGLDVWYDVTHSRTEQSAGPYHCEIIIINFPSSIQTVKGKSRKTESLKNVVVLGEWRLMDHNFYVTSIVVEDRNDSEQ